MQGEIDVLVQRLDERRRELDKEEKIRRNQESDLRQILYIFTHSRDQTFRISSSWTAKIDVIELLLVCAGSSTVVCAYMNTMKTTFRFNFWFLTSFFCNQDIFNYWFIQYVLFFIYKKSILKIFRREMDRICKAAELRELELKKELEASRIKAQSMLLIC